MGKLVPQHELEKLARKKLGKKELISREARTRGIRIGSWVEKNLNSEVKLSSIQKIKRHLRIVS